VAGRHELTATEWARMAPLLPARETRGTYYADHRRVLNGMLYRHATGCAWRGLPERYAPWPTVASRQRRWTREGLWDRIVAALQGELTAAGSRPSGTSSLTGAGSRWRSRSAAGWRTRVCTPHVCSTRYVSRAWVQDARVAVPWRSRGTRATATRRFAGGYDVTACGP
jgi:transposase